MTEAVLQLSGVHTHIGQYHILHGIDFVVPEGEITVLLGRNGAGKTTTLRTIMGLWRASRGEIIFAGQNLVARETDQIALRTGKHGNIRRPDGEGEHGSCRPRRIVRSPPT
jgi:branched-chain amino acid transport system ATP-binding protein